jgi:hypothetical protein
MRYRRKNLRRNDAAGSRSERILDESFQAVRLEQLPTTDFSAVRAGVTAKAVRHTGKEVSVMARISTRLRNHPALGMSFATVIVLVLFAVLVPLPYSAIVGYDVAIAGADGGSQVSLSQVNQALAALGYGGASVNFENTEGEMSFTITGLQTRAAAREAAAAFSTLTGCHGAVEYRPVVKQVSGSLLAQAREKLFQVDVDATGKTDSEIAAEIAAKLESQGLGAPNVTVTTNSEGARQITIESDGSQSGSGSGDTSVMEINMSDGQQ